MNIQLWRNHLVLLIVTFIVHGLLILNDGLYWDSWVPVLLERDNLIGFWVNIGLPLHGFYHTVILAMPAEVFVSKLAIFIWLVLITLLTYQIALKTSLLSRQDSLLVALMSLVYPSYHHTIDLVVGPYYFFYMFFMVGVWLAFVARGRWLFRAAALFMLFQSFWLNSVLVFHYGFVLLLALVYLKERGCPRPNFQLAVDFVVRHADYIALPLAFWVLRVLFFPDKSGYYDIRLSPAILSDTVAYLRVILEQLNLALAVYASFPIGLIIVGVGVRLLYQSVRGETPALSPRFALVMLGFALIWLLMAIAPYVVVNALPSATGLNSRSMILVPIPMAIGLVSISHLMFGNAEVSGFQLRVVALLLIGFSFSTFLIDGYFGWQARWAKDRAILQEMRAHLDMQDVSVLWVDDTFTLGGEEVYNSIDWEAMLINAYEEQSPHGTGFPVLHYPLIHRIRRAPNGCQAVLTIRRGPKPLILNNSFGLSVRYLLFKTVGNLDGFLNDLTDIEIRRIVAPQATDCAAQQEFLAAADGDFSFLEDQDWAVQKYRTDLIAFLERSVDETLPPYTDTAFSFFENGGYPNPQGESLDYFISRGIASLGNTSACQSEDDLSLAESFGFDREYFYLYCAIASQSIETEAFPN